MRPCLLARPDGTVVTGLAGEPGRAGRTLTAFVSADGTSWRQTRPFGTSAAEAVSGVALAQDGAVVTAGISTAQA